jgi:DNA-binding protein HU-beta
MNKADLITQIASEADIPKAKAEKALGAFVNGVTKALRKEESVTLVGFGTFSVSRRAARKGRNPQTGKEIRIPATKAPKFRAGKSLKDAVK